MVRNMVDCGQDVVVLHHLPTGHREAVEWVTLIEDDVGDRDVLDALIDSRDFGAVIHLFAHSLVGDSVKRGVEYYQNNVAATLNLLQAMNLHGVFSSTAAVFGHLQQRPIADMGIDP